MNFVTKGFSWLHFLINKTIMASEKRIENYLIQEWERETGGMCVKFPPLFYAGFPDRICLCYPAVIIFVETKAPGETPRLLQSRVHAALRRLGFRVETIDTREGVDEFVTGVSLAL